MDGSVHTQTIRADVLNIAVFDGNLITSVLNLFLGS